MQLVMLTHACAKNAACLSRDKEAALFEVLAEELQESDITYARECVGPDHLIIALHQTPDHVVGRDAYVTRVIAGILHLDIRNIQIS